ncbi:hypothetical protein C725_1934 [Pacificimonas flava]|uniref:Uncharacterized protein n=1 Tax=Pacificimonas flava TaxID=1234595 RepID=M2U3E9_9SPHN|nr:hypothetical protein C725_1934 [Pacificimonas flava]
MDNLSGSPLGTPRPQWAAGGRPDDISRALHGVETSRQAPLHPCKDKMSRTSPYESRAEVSPAYGEPLPGTRLPIRHIPDRSDPRS